MIKSSIPYLFSFAILFCTQKSFSAACCGGGFSVPSIIAGDDKTQLTSSYSYSKLDSDVSVNGVWQKRSNSDLTQIFKFDGASIYKDRYQFGASIPIHQRNMSGPQGGQASGLGDISLLSGYEYLPDWDYHPWRPKGIGYLSLTLPTGKSIHEEDNFSGINSRGRGFWALGAGTLLTKTFKKMDAFANFELHKSFAKKVSTSQLQGELVPGLGYSLTLGIGYNWDKIRFGHTISWLQEDPIKTTGSINTPGEIQRVATGSLSLSYLLEDYLSGSLTYSDQAWYGEPVNTGLNKTILLSLQKRWPR
jgi:hypothetical protein